MSYPLQNWWIQAANANRIRQDSRQKLQAEGWIYNAQTRCWTHPNKPNEMILEG